MIYPLCLFGIESHPSVCEVVPHCGIHPSTVCFVIVELDLVNFFSFCLLAQGESSLERAHKRKGPLFLILVSLFFPLQMVRLPVACERPTMIVLTYQQFWLAPPPGNFLLTSPRPTGLDEL